MPCHLQIGGVRRGVTKTLKSEARLEQSTIIAALYKVAKCDVGTPGSRVVDRELGREHFSYRNRRKLAGSEVALEVVADDRGGCRAEEKKRGEEKGIESHGEGAQWQTFGMERGAGRRPSNMDASLSNHS